MIATAYQVTIFGLELNINSVAIPTSEAGGIKWYGILIALGFILALVYGYLNAKRLGINVDRMLDVILVATPCGILGARTYFVLFDPEGQINSIGEFFGFYENGFKGFSGLAIYGGIIGAAISGIIMAKIRKVSILDLLDLAAIGFLIGQAVGRWGNFFNQEAFGTPTGSDWWGMSSVNTGNVLVHPCFLYESIWCIAGAVLLHFVSRKRKFSGQVALLYCVWYGFGRAIIETMRTDSLALIPMEGVTGTEIPFYNRVSFVLSLALCLGSIIVMLIIMKKHRTAVTDTKYETMFNDEMTGGVISAENSEDEEGFENDEPAVQESLEQESEKAAPEEEEK